MQLENLQRLFDLIVEAPLEWFRGGKGEPVVPEGPKIEGIKCESYRELVDAWDKTYHNPPGKGEERPKVALQWNDEIDVAFSTMLAVIASTKQQGAQVWLRVIGPPGSAKSTLCAALEANKQYVYTMAKLTGFHSGTEGSNIIKSLRNMTCIVNEGDMLMSQPPNVQATIMGELRDLWSGKTSATYRNGIRYEESGIRSTWIIAGTATLRRLNKSAAGDRFLDVVIHTRKVKGGEDVGERALLTTVAKLAVERTRNESQESAESLDTPEKIYAIQKTIGFVNYLRETSPQKVGAIEVPEEVLKKCINLAQIVAYLRARPDIKAEAEETEAELATRLTEQFVRVAICEALVLDTPIDKEVMRRVALVAYHTCKGPSLTLCEAMMARPDGIDAIGLEARTEYRADTVRHFLEVLKQLGCLRLGNNRAASGATRRATGIFRLTPQMIGLLKNLYSLIGKEIKK